MGAITVTKDSRPRVVGAERMVKGTITMAASYATNGDTGLTPSAMGLRRLDRVIINPMGGYVLVPDLTNSKVLAYEASADGSALDEVTATTDISAVVAPFVAYGK